MIFKSKNIHCVYQLVVEFLFFVFIFKHVFLKYITETESDGFPNASRWEKSKASLGSDYGLEQAKHLLSSNTVSNREQEVNPDSDSTLEELSGHSLMR